ncbi:hypothetical protein R5R35_007719 [Gryllus longicercus]
MADIEEMDICIKIGRRQTNNLSYADDTMLISDTREDLERLVIKIAEESRKAGLKLNLKETTFMSTGEKGNLDILGEVVDMADEVEYLGITITSSGHSNYRDDNYSFVNIILIERKVEL